VRIFLLFIGILSVLEAKKPTLELGLGMVGLSYPAYLGASKQKFLALPVPYIQYRGDMFEVDGSGIKKSLFDINGLSMDVSLSGSLPVDSGSSKLREGMEDLDFVFEIGPKLTYKVWQEEGYKLSFRLPIRSVISTNFEDDMSHRGFFTSPQFKIAQNYHDREISWTSGVVFASEDYHDYFYGVDEKYATAQRSAYSAKGGYGGFRNELSFSDQQGSWVYDAYVIHYLLDGAVFEDSPLVEQKNGLFIQVSLSYIFYTK